MRARGRLSPDSSPYTLEADSVDFDRQMVIAAFAGTKPTGGHALELVRIETGAEVRVYYRETAPPAGADDWYTMHALVREFVLETWPVAASELRVLRRRAARSTSTPRSRRTCGGSR